MRAADHLSAICRKDRTEDAALWMCGASRHACAETLLKLISSSSSSVSRKAGTRPHLEPSWPLAVRALLQLVPELALKLEAEHSPRQRERWQFPSL
jgi:hypothetical protein